MYSRPTVLNCKIYNQIDKFKVPENKRIEGMGLIIQPPTTIPQLILNMF